MKIKSLTSFANGVNGKSFSPGVEYDVTDAEGLEYVTANLALDLTPPPPVEEKAKAEVKAAKHEAK